MSPLRHCLSIALGAITFATAKAALACGGLPCIQVEDVQPGDGATRIPLNTEIRILYFGTLDGASAQGSCDLELTQVQLVADDGAEMTLTGTLLERPEALEAWVVARASEPLRANTPYSIRARTSSGPCGCDELPWETLASFRTGAARDDEPPVFSGVSRFDYGDLVESHVDCGLFRAIPVTPRLRAPADTSPGLAYNIYVDGTLEKRYVETLAIASSSTELNVDCGTVRLVPSLQLASGSQIELRAVDIAGNESPPNRALSLAASCEPEAAGCTLTHGTEQRPTPWLLALMLIAGRARRSRV